MARPLDPGLSHQVHVWKTRIKNMPEGFPGGSVVKNPLASPGDADVIPAMGTVATREPGVPESGCRSPGRLRRDTLLEIEPPGRSRHDGLPRIGSLGSSSHDNLLRPLGLEDPRAG